MKKVKVEEVAKVIEAAKAAKGAARTKEVKKLRRLVSRQYYARTMVEYVIRQVEISERLIGKRSFDAREGRKEVR